MYLIASPAENNGPPITAVAAAFVPPPPVNVMAGGLPSAYLLPGLVIVIAVTAPFATVAVPVAVVPVLSGGAAIAIVGELV